MSFPTESIQPIAHSDLNQAIWTRLDNLTKPPKSLGRLEEFVVRYCMCRGSADTRIEKKAMFVFAGDHGITAEGVAPFPKEVTPQMVMNMVAGGAAISVMCKHAGIACNVVDMGVDADFDEAPGLVRAKVGRGTRSFLKECAMSAEELDTALKAGYDLACESGADILGIGEMGIGNTSSASALSALLLGIDGASTVGRGTGADGELLERKRSVIDQAVRFHKDDWDGTPLDALRRVGGFEIAGMTGFMLGAASKRIPVVVDGFIASAAALTAVKTDPASLDYLLFGHVSNEQFHRSMLDSLDVRPILDLDMRLGEGTGAALAIQIVEQAMNCYHEMATFESAGVSNKDD